MTQHRKEKWTFSSLRIPTRLWKHLGKIAETKGLSKSQCIERALLVYCFFNDPDFAADPVAKEEWEAALRQMEKHRRLNLKGEQAKGTQI